MEYYSALKKNVLMHATTWINFENIMLNERSQSQKNTYCMMVAQFCEYAKTAEIVHFKRVNFICELYLYKAVTFLNVYSIPQ